MIDQKTGDVSMDEIEDLQLRSLYNIAGLQFVILDGIVKGSYQIAKSEEDETAWLKGRKNPQKFNMKVDHFVRKKLYGSTTV